jgi:uncharacterized membrane protein YbaN (DUF454 family)
MPPVWFDLIVGLGVFGGLLYVLTTVFYAVVDVVFWLRSHSTRKARADV